MFELSNIEIDALNESHSISSFDTGEYINELYKELYNQENDEECHEENDEEKDEESESTFLLDEIFEEDFLIDMEESIYLQIDEYDIKNIFHIDDILKEKITESITENILQSIYLICDDNSIERLHIEEKLIDKDIYQFIKERVDIYFQFIFPNIHSIEQIPRSIKKEIYDSHSSPSTISTINKNELEEKINILKNQYQPEQRTQEWYEFRNTIMTASNIYKIFGTQSQYNSFICEKCLPPKIDTFNNTNGSRHWGQKYEPLTIQIYEELYNTKVSEFGCIRHSKYPYIGASPDGIVTGDNYFGRMIEVKNIVNRVITGIPIESYWVQMQIQMEVCDLDICDFIETRFKECETIDMWKNVCSEKIKGIVVSNIPIRFSVENINIIPKYEFIIFKEGINEIETFIEQWSSNTMEVKWWYMDEFSCVVVPRNKEWFRYALPKITETWNIILNERNGEKFKERLPKKKNAKCLLPIDKYTIVVKKEGIDDFIQLDS